MDIFKKKQKLKKKKKLIEFIEDCSQLDEISIKTSGDLKNKYLKIVLHSIMQSFQIDTKIPTWIKELEGLSGRKFRYFLNILIENLEKPRYLEIGSWLGSTACSASYGNNLKLTCIDDWSQTFKGIKEPRKKFYKNLNRSLNKNSVTNVLETDYKQINYKGIGKHNVFFFDGPHHKKDHFDAIILTQDALEDEFIMIIDDWNWKQVRDGTNQALKTLNLKIISFVEIRTTQNDLKPLFEGKNSDWHNGYALFIIRK